MKVGCQHLAQVAPDVLDLSILGQLAPGQPPPGDALETGPLEVVGFDAPLGRGPLREQPLKHTPRHPDHSAVLADLDPELHARPAAQHSSGRPGGTTVGKRCPSRYPAQRCGRMRHTHLGEG